MLLADEYLLEPLVIDEDDGFVTTGIDVFESVLARFDEEEESLLSESPCPRFF